MVGVAALLASRSRMIDRARMIAPSETEEASGTLALPNETDCYLATALVLAVLVQTLLGTLVRQMDVGLIVHISAAMLVAMLAIVTGVRLWGLYPQIAVFARGGVALMGVVVLQLMLGGISLVFRTSAAVDSPLPHELQAGTATLRPAVNAVLTTAHQTTAAVLLAIAVLLAVWVWRLMPMQGSAVAADAPATNA